MLKFFKRKEISSNNSTNNDDDTTTTTTNTNNTKVTTLPININNNNNSNGTTTTNISTSGERKLKTKLSKVELTKGGSGSTSSGSINGGGDNSGNSGNSSLASSPRSSNDKAEKCIRDIPYDLLGKLLALIHCNRILTKDFMTTSLVCKKWRALSRLNGNHINLESFFKKAESSKMRVETIENCMNYFAYIYQSLEVIDLGKSCINNRINSKYSIFLIENIEKITRLSLDMAKVTLSEFEVVSSSLKSLKSIKELTITNMHQVYTGAMIPLFESLPELETLNFVDINFENSTEDHDAFIAYMKKNNTISKLSIVCCPDNNRFLNSLKTIVNSNRALKNITCCTSMKRPSLPNSTSSNSLPQSASINSTSPISNSMLALQNSWSVSKFQYSHDSLKELNLSNMSLTDSDIIELAENVLCSNQSLKSLDISWNKKVSSASLESFFKTLNKNHDMKLQRLNLSGLSINDTCISLIGDYIGANQSIQEIIINDCIEQYWSDGFKNFSASLSNHRSLTNLQLNRNRIETKCFDDLALSISNNNSHVRTLGLSGTLSNAQSLHLICNSLGSNSNLVSLDISNCEVSYCPSLTESLAKNYHLEKLNVNNCKLNQTTLLGMANSHLSILDIGSNVFTSGDALLDFFESLKSNNSLYVLNLSNTGLKTKECHALSNLLELNRKILSIDLSNNKIKSSDVQCIVKCIQQKNLPSSSKFNMKLKDTKIDICKFSNDLLNNQILVD